MSTSHNFIATAAGVDENEDCLVATLDSAADAYLMFQRHPEPGHDDDNGVYVEIDDQTNAGFNIVDRCVVTPTDILVNLTSALKGHAELRATFNMPLDELAAFTVMLHRIFIGFDDRLVMETQT